MTFEQKKIQVTCRKSIHLSVFPCRDCDKVCVSNEDMNYHIPAAHVRRADWYGQDNRMSNRIFSDHSNINQAFAKLSPALALTGPRLVIPFDKPPTHPLLDLLLG